jgi:tRNA-specific 2-thiouridylase
MATGHYARVIDREGTFGLQRAADREKDQSYVLSVLGQDQLRKAVFPLGGLTKPEVRAHARRLGLSVADRRESQDLCFLAGQDYREFLGQIAPARPGPILQRDGAQVGEHAGLSQYTIGQRKGLGLAFSKPRYVVGKDTLRNAVIVGPREELAREEFMAGPAHWVSGASPVGPSQVGVQVRYRSREVRATVTSEASALVRVRTQDPLYDVTPGQAAVFYEGEDCLGMAIIRS